MKQVEIKAGRFYRNNRSEAVRFVVSVGDPSAKKRYVFWQSLPSKAGKVAYVVNQLLRSFARWADEEVRPIFHAVRRCPDCDRFCWKDEMPLNDHHCEKCGALVQSEHDY